MKYPHLYVAALHDVAITELYPDFSLRTPRRDVHCTIELGRILIESQAAQVRRLYQNYAKAYEL